MLPEIPSLPEIQAINARGLTAGAEYALRNPLPGMVGAGMMSDARRREAEQYANDMRAAFFYNKLQTKQNRARAKAKGRAAQRYAERR